MVDRLVGLGGDEALGVHACPAVADVVHVADAEAGRADVVAEVAQQAPQRPLGLRQLRPVAAAQHPIGELRRRAAVLALEDGDVLRELRHGPPQALHAAEHAVWIERIRMVRDGVDKAELAPLPQLGQERPDVAAAGLAERAGVEPGCRLDGAHRLGGPDVEGGELVHGHFVAGVVRLVPDFPLVDVLAVARHEGPDERQPGFHRLAPRQRGLRHGQAAFGPVGGIAVAAARSARSRLRGPPGGGGFHAPVLPRRDRARWGNRAAQGPHRSGALRASFSTR